MTTSPQRIGLSLAPTKQMPLQALVELARHTEQRGFESIWVPETWSHDAVSVLSLLAIRTSSIGIASGVLNVYSRSAALLAQTAATLQELSGGRFILGLGSSGPIVVEHWHGVPFTSPLRRTREYVEIIRQALSGEHVSGPIDSMRIEGFRLGNPPSSPVPIYLAALGPKNVRLAGRIADGWLPIFAARGELSHLLAEIQMGAEEAGRDPASIDVAAYLPAASGPRGDTLLRQQIAYYVGGMGTFYATFVERLGLGQEAARIRERWQAGDRRGAVLAVDGRLLDLCTLGSDGAVARARLDQYRSTGIALPIVVPAHGSTVDEIAAIVDTLAPTPV